jgi:hypothetical protein
MEHGILVSGFSGITGVSGIARTCDLQPPESADPAVTCYLQ